jgi:cell division protein FtsQ
MKLQFKNIGLLRILKISFFSIAVLSAIAFVEKKHDIKRCNKIVVSIDNEFENYFVDEEDIRNRLNSNKGNLVGVAYAEIDLKTLEKIVEKNPFVKDAQVYSDLEGNMQVEIQQNKPVARILTQNGAYISTCCKDTHSKWCLHQYGF